MAGAYSLNKKSVFGTAGKLTHFPFPYKITKRCLEIVQKYWISCKNNAKPIVYLAGNNKVMDCAIPLEDMPAVARIQCITFDMLDAAISQIYLNDCLI